jgi:hypothetical protein
MRITRKIQGDGGVALMPPSQRGSVTVTETGYDGEVEIILQGDMTRARPQRLWLSTGARELAATLTELADGGAA